MSRPTQAPDAQKSIWRFTLTLICMIVLLTVATPILIGGACTAVMVGAAAAAKDAEAGAIHHTPRKAEQDAASTEGR
tara:strand:+ start:5201 stop:5431 length:231 start_codon:yes stop_codon:yes gene_type:complete